MDEVEPPQTNFRTDYRNPNVPMPRRLASLWAQSEMLGWICGAWGLFAGAIPRAFQAAVSSGQASPNGKPIPPMRLITLGALSTSAAIGVPLSLIPMNLMIMDGIGVTSLLRRVDGFNTGKTQYSPYNADTLLAAVLGGLSCVSLQKKIDAQLVARGMPNGGPGYMAGIALGVGGVAAATVWRERRWEDDNLN
ncbi:hypothetical protein MKEN_00296400 [Mycena kentingensis (nom. inval.)]|nr:hypothetical protein MKEN_00296400 [Mycena kentingensis (nom. inval.)]